MSDKQRCRELLDEMKNALDPASLVPAEKALDALAALWGGMPRSPMWRHSLIEGIALLEEKAPQLAQELRDRVNILRGYL